jgi:nickel-dependent lactate racemase
MIPSQATAPDGSTLPPEEIRRTLRAALERKTRNQRVLVLIPDHTRSIPLPFLFRTLCGILDGAAQVDFLVALGTHPPLTEEELLRLAGLTSPERRGAFARVGLRNHAWQDDSALAQIGVIGEDELRRISGPAWHPSLAGDLPVRINRAALECDQLVLLAPTFPHEVAGFSGGGKYICPGIAGSEMIHRMHWLGALIGLLETMGVRDTPVRALIERATGMLPTPVTLLALVPEADGLAGVFAGDCGTAWPAAVDLSARRHIRRMPHPFRRALACAAPIYDELWTAAKAAYKTMPVMAEGGEIILFAPHLTTISRTHGSFIERVGYHILPYFLQDLERFRDIPLSVLAHSAHLRGPGEMVNGVERPRFAITLASGISRAECKRLNLGYLDPATITPADWKNRESEGILLVERAGEMVYQLE